ncbi:MAG: hypothetical protein IIX99_00900 [Oscillospiraceae bacterium]|nr:hypothetical protein [Oscillospiraceae bacterium]
MATEGRRVRSRAAAPRRNPLYVLFLCLVAAVFVLLIVSIVLGIKLGSTSKKLEAAEAQIELLEKGGATVSPEQADPVVDPEIEQQPEEQPPVEEKPVEEKPVEKEPAKEVKVGWLDLTGHSEVSVLPEKVFDEYATYYTNAGVNMRGGPATSHKKIMLVDEGTAVKAAAKDGEWTFVSV